MGSSKITPNGWEILGGKNIPTVFRRIFGNQQSQVRPNASHDYPDDILEQYISLFHLKSDDKENTLLLECYIISLFLPDIAKAILMLHGDPGSAKSMKQTLIRRTVDPSSLDTVAFSKDKNELNQKLNNNYISYFDNVSQISDEISDMLCRAATGAGDSKRRLYTDDEDYITNYIRCIGFNGINLAANKTDLLDRGLIIETERLDDPKEEKEIYEKLDQIKPQLLAFIFDKMVEVLKYRQTAVDMKLPKLPRMAGFAKLAEAISRCIGNNDYEFINAYRDNTKLQNDRVFESNIISAAVIELTKIDKQWKGTTTELLSELNVIADKNLGIDIKSSGWPKSPSKLSEKLNLIKVNLKSIGITVNRSYEDRKKSKKLVEIIANDASDASADTLQNRAQYEGADDADDADGTSDPSSGGGTENSDPNYGDDHDYFTPDYVCLDCGSRKIKGDSHLPTLNDCTCENREVIEQ